MTNHLLVDLSDGVLTLTLNRPERRNALSEEMLDALAQQLAGAADDDAVRCVVLTGAGGAFCAGGDVQQFHEGGGVGEAGAEAETAQLASQRATTGAIWTFPKPVIAALPGAVAGAGIGLSLAADIRIGTPRTVMATAFVGVALPGDYGVPWLLSRAVGPIRARELMLTSPRLDAEACRSLGLVTTVVAADELETAVGKWAAGFVAGPQSALRAAKADLIDADRMGLDDYMANEVKRLHECSRHPDHREAVSAFVEKRPPVFE